MIEILMVFSKENCFAGILEARDNAKVEMRSPGFGSFIHRCCGKTDVAPVTGDFTRYTKVLNMIYRRNKYQGWLKEKLRLKNFLLKY